MNGEVLGNALLVRTSDVAATHLRNATTWVFSVHGCLRDAGFMADAPQWDGKIYKQAKPGEGFRWDTADGAQRREQIGRQRKRYSAAWREAKLEAEEWPRRPFRVKVSAILIECLLWPLKVIGRFRG